MRETSVRIVEGEGGEAPGESLATDDACFWRQEEAVASRMKSPVKDGRRENFAGVGCLPAKREEPTSAEPLDGYERRAKRGAAEQPFVWRKSGRRPARLLAQASRTATLSGSEAPVKLPPNQTPEPTPLAVTIPAYAGLAPSSVVAHL